jgi:hypothetical protein
VKNHRVQPFESIESAQEFMALLASAADEALGDLMTDREQACARSEERRLQALDLAAFKMKQLQDQIQRCRKTLNDLRTIRRLLLGERAPVSN